MKEFKGTKGKWRIGSDNAVNDENGFEIADVSAIYRVRENWDKFGFGHWSEGRGQTYVDINEDEAEANARLIASAPDLLEALQNLVDLQEKKTLDGKFEGYQVLRDKAWDDAKKAIKKALK